MSLSQKTRERGGRACHLYPLVTLKSTVKSQPLLVLLLLGLFSPCLRSTSAHYRPLLKEQQTIFWAQMNLCSLNQTKPEIPFGDNHL